MDALGNYITSSFISRRVLRDMSSSKIYRMAWVLNAITKQGGTAGTSAFNGFT